MMGGCVTWIESRIKEAIFLSYSSLMLQHGNSDSKEGTGYTASF